MLVFVRFGLGFCVEGGTCTSRCGTRPRKPNSRHRLHSSTKVSPSTTLYTYPIFSSSLTPILTRHLCSSQLYQTFDEILLLSQGQALYNGPGSFAPARHFTAQGIPYQEGYNVADYLLEIASDSDLSSGSPPVLVQCPSHDEDATRSRGSKEHKGCGSGSGDAEKGNGEGLVSDGDVNGVAVLPGTEKSESRAGRKSTRRGWKSFVEGQGYATTFLTQFEVLAGREWKILRRYTQVSSSFRVF